MQGHCVSFVSFLVNNNLKLFYLTSCNFSYQAIFLLEFIKFEDKSVAWKSGGPGLLLTRAIKKYCGKSIQLIVGDVELRGVIKSNLVSRCLFSCFFYVFAFA